MKTTNLIVAICLGIFLFSASSFASDEKTEVKKNEVKKEEKNQTNCPVMGGKIDSTVFTDIQGQRVYHCCPMCSAKLKADPDTYFKKAAEEGIVFENIQTTCPVSGEELDDKTHVVDYEGRRLYFCCNKCIKTFNEDPQKVLKSMDKKEEKSEMKKEETEDHTGHNH